MLARDNDLNDVRDVLLADVAIRIQLPPSTYQLPTDRVASWQRGWIAQIAR